MITAKELQETTQQSVNIEELDALIESITSGCLNEAIKGKYVYNFGVHECYEEVYIRELFRKLKEQGLKVGRTGNRFDLPYYVSWYPENPPNNE